MALSFVRDIFVSPQLSPFRWAGLLRSSMLDFISEVAGSSPRPTVPSDASLEHSEYKKVVARGGLCD